MSRRPRAVMRWLAAIPVLALVGAGTAVLQAPAAYADHPVTTGQPLRIVSKYQGVWTSPPTVLANGETTDAPLIGNGDYGAAIAGTIDNQTIYLGKNDFFSTASNAVQPLGRIVLSVPGLAGAGYHVVQDIAHARIEGTYALDGSSLTATSWMSATENALVTSLRLSGTASQHVTITVQNGSGGTPAVSAHGRILDADVAADTTGTDNPQVRMASTVVGGTTTTSGNTLSLTLAPGTTYDVVTGFGASTEDRTGWQSRADHLVSSLSSGAVRSLSTAHQAWWTKYWSNSYVEIPDKAVEKSWYGSLYLLGSTSRGNAYAPGLWGNWATGPMNWNGDYHTNYNYEAPFYAALSTNHIDQIAAYDRPVLDYMSAAQDMAKANGYQGVMFPVGFSPRGTSSNTSTYNQKSDAVNVASDMVMHYQYTHDAAYARQVYPFLKQVGLFWQNYLTKDSDGVYNDLNDACQEGATYPQTNCILSLGLIHLLMQGLVDMSTALHQDAGLRTTWRDIDTHLAPLPTMTRNGQTVFSQTSTGVGWVDDENDIAIQAVYPGLQVGLDSSADVLQTARNTVGQLARWHGQNAPATFYPAAAIVGYNPNTIMEHLHAEATSNSYPNMAVYHGGGGIENLNVVTSGLDEMLLQSFQKDVKVFADWPANSNAKFGDLLAYGDFLISSSISDNTVQYVRAVSQAGGPFTFTNPWPGTSVQVYRNGAAAGTVSGTKITLQTAKGDTLDLAPAGTSHATITHEIAQPQQTGATSSFSTGFESTDPAPTWTDSIEPLHGGSYNVSGIKDDVPAPEAGIRTGEQAHTGTSALVYSGGAAGDPSYDYAYMQLYDLSQAPLTVGPQTTLTYWVFPQSNATTPWVPPGSTESTCVAVDLVFGDGTTLRDSGAVDQNGTRAHPAFQCGHLTVDTWNKVTVPLGTDNNGKQISRVLFGYDHGGGSGGYRGYVDDIGIS